MWERAVKFWMPEDELWDRTPVGLGEAEAGAPSPDRWTASHVGGQATYCEPGGAEAQTAPSRLELMRNPLNGLSPLSLILTVFDGRAGSRTCERVGAESRG